jgi:hypothetical protein
MFSKFRNFSFYQTTETGTETLSMFWTEKDIFQNFRHNRNANYVEGCYYCVEICSSGCSIYDVSKGVGEVT